MESVRSLAFALATTAVVALLNTAVVAQSGADPAARITHQPSSTFDAVKRELQSKTRIPLRFPTFLPETAGQQVFAVLQEADPSRYNILLATALPGAGGNNCFYGSLEGSTSPLDPVEGKTVPVVLRGGIRGQFTPFRCGAFCGQAYIRWKEGGVFYSIGVKAGKKSGLLKAARSALGAIHSETT
jgi:hypothetical protein